jgi:hypothetical protein
MRVLILALSVLGILVSTDAAKAGPSTTNRDVSASIDPAIFTDEATQETEDQIGLDKGKRRDVQRRLTRLGFDTKVNGRFDPPTRAVITRCGPSPPQRHRPAWGVAKNPMTLVPPVVAAGVAPAITAAVAAPLA